MTIPGCLNSIDELMDDASPEEREILCDYYTWLQRMIRNPGFMMPRRIKPPDIPF